MDIKVLVWLESLSMNKNYSIGKQKMVSKNVDFLFWIILEICGFKAAHTDIAHMENHKTGELLLGNLVE